MDAGSRLMQTHRHLDTTRLLTDAIDDAQLSRCERVQEQFRFCRSVRRESSPCETFLSPADLTTGKIFEQRHYRDPSGRHVSPLLLAPDRDRLDGLLRHGATAPATAGATSRARSTPTRCLH
ncbi:hypothetical protein EVAR_49242_1 [Eumeta japonica]|uniref:Uncharacterized protein n=1 Tax=Eumeta variegata TaxID=151549 RepID=A0A4C1YF17_EUMVA|nr:hypothetical protein EVAR_49242_1 [Eumeta japonica]